MPPSPVAACLRPPGPAGASACSARQRGPAALVGAALGLLLLGGCSLDAPTRGTVLTPAGCGIDCVSRATFQTRVRYTDILTTDVIFPSDETGLQSGSEHPGLVFVQDKGTSTDAYLWLATALASSPYDVVVALPHHPYDDPALAQDNATFAHDLLVSPPGGSLLTGQVSTSFVAVAGHAYGAQVAAKLAADHNGDGTFAALGLFGGLPDGDDLGALSGYESPSLLVAGGNDCDVPLGSVAADAARLPPPTASVVVPGMSHHQFTDSDSADTAVGCAPSLDLATAHDRAAAAATAFFAAALTSPASNGADALVVVSGTEVTARPVASPDAGAPTP